MPSGAIKQKKKNYIVIKTKKKQHRDTHTH